MDANNPGFFDHTQQPADPIPKQKEEVVEKTEATPSEQEKEEAEKPVEGENGEGEEGDEESDKPWKAKKSGKETPAWAKKRFKEYSTQVQELRRQNEQLMQMIGKPASEQDSTPKTLKKEDFESEEAFLEAKVEAKLQEKLTAYEEQQRQHQQAMQRQHQLQMAEQRNTQAALTDLPDYQQVIETGDPEIRLPQAVLQHLSVSPAGPYVKYRIASDDALADAIKAADRLPQGQREAQKQAIIAQVHDSILDYLAQKNNGAGAPAVAPQAPTQAPPLAQTQYRPAPPKAPPKQKNKPALDRNSLSGDEYVRARNEGRI